MHTCTHMHLVIIMTSITISNTPDDSSFRTTVTVVQKALASSGMYASSIALDVIALANPKETKQLLILSSKGSEVGVFQWNSRFVQLLFVRTSTTLRADPEVLEETQTTLDVDGDELYLLALFSLLYNWQREDAVSLTDNVKLVFSTSSEATMPLLSKAFEWSREHVQSGFGVYVDLCDALLPGALYDCVGRLYKDGVDAAHLVELMGLFACSRNVDIDPFCKSCKHPLLALVSFIHANKDITDRSLYYMTALICEKFKKQ